MPSATEDSGVDITEQDVFVLELDGSAMLAFQAAEGKSASAIMRSDWFKIAVGRFRPDRPFTETAVLRPATDAEASTFHDFAEEFAEPTRHFFVAQLAATACAS